MKRIWLVLTMAGFILAGILPEAFCQTVIVPITITVDPTLELSYWVREVPALETDPYIPGTRDVTSMNFLQLKRDLTYGWYGSDYYFIAFLIANTSQRPYVLKQSFTGFYGGNNNVINLSKSIIMTPQFCPLDRWTWFTNPEGADQGDMPAEDSLGDEQSRKKIINPSTGAFIYTGRWKTANYASELVIYNGNSGKSQIIRCVYGIFTADPAYRAIHDGAWPDGIANPADGLILPNKLSGLTGATTVSGAITFTLTLK